jgi:phosphoribosylformylglycinamidine synthase
MPERPPRLDRAREEMEIWEIGPASTGNMAGSAFQRVVDDELTGRPTAPDPEMARHMVDLTSSLADQVPVLHDVSDGGLAVAVAEVCISSGIGATLDIDEPGDLFCEDPHRVIAVFEQGSVDLPAELARRVGKMGGKQVSLGDAAPVDLETLARTHREAIPRRMAG